ncbi:MAG: aminotransferase class V-fold PLP-dependent enzyme [Synergistaceae bacterium]|nr:aminotransferase class V-fold PLP-dependent enzyme [Synergistaceae bacterium]
MIYFDNSATTLIKPSEVAKAVKYAIDHFGNAGRSFYGAVMLANREIYRTRKEIADLAELEDPLRVAFTSSSTESLNLVIRGLVKKEDHVITTVLEHNSVLRPLYLTGCDLSILECDDKGDLLLDTFESLAKPSTKFCVCTHGSNVIGNVTDIGTLYAKCKRHGITLILDVSQTFGAIPVKADMADILCFTGHKALFGPQGTGGIIAKGPIEFAVVKTGGAGVNSFERSQSTEMPDVFEAGTPNSHGIFGLQKGVQFINAVGLDKIWAKERSLATLFYDSLKNLARVTFYGTPAAPGHLAVFALNVEGLDSSDLAARLWEDHGIATRAGSHCAPLLHQRFGTVDRGMVRFSFSYFNTRDEIRRGVEAIQSIVQSLG